MSNADDLRIGEPSFARVIVERDVAREQAGAYKADALRLDFLDQCNGKMNARYGTTYGWRFDWNHNRVCVLADHNWPALSVRAAIDAAIAASQPAEGKRS